MDIFNTYPSPHTERTFVSGLLRKPEWAARAVAEGAQADWLLMPGAAAVAGAAFDGFRDQGAFDLDTVYALLEERRQLGAHCVHPSDLVDLSTTWVDAAAFDDALLRLKRGARLRQLWKAVEDLRSDVFTSEAITLRQRTERLEGGLSSLVAFAAGESKTMHTAETLGTLAMTAGEFIPTGLWSLDESIRGYVPRRVTVLAGRPSHGKTAAALDLALRMARRARRDGGQVVYFSAEMSAHAISHRLVATLAGLDSRNVMDHKYGGSDADAARSGAEDLARLPLVVDDAASPTTAYILGRCLALSASRPVRLVVFDYLQYTGEKAESRRLSLDQALRGLHETAKRLNCPVLCLAQLNREIDKRGGASEPQLADMKETGALEEVPSLVLMVHHPWTHAYQLGKGKNDMLEIDERDFRIYVRKNTHGPLGAVTLDFNRRTGRITDPHEPAL